MEILLSMMFGLSLRMILSSTQGRLYAAMIGVWEGACLRYLTNQAANTANRVPQANSDSLDPFLSFGVRLCIDYFITNSCAQLFSIALWSMLCASVIGIAEGLEVEDVEVFKSGSTIPRSRIEERNRRRLSLSRYARPTLPTIPDTNHRTRTGTSSTTINRHATHVTGPVHSDMPSASSSMASPIGAQVATPGGDSVHGEMLDIPVSIKLSSASSSPLRIPFPRVPEEEVSTTSPRIPMASDSEFASESIDGSNTNSDSYDSYTLPHSFRNSPPIATESPLPILLNFIPVSREEPESYTYRSSPMDDSESQLDPRDSIDELQTPLLAPNVLIPDDDDDDDEESYRDELRTPRALALQLALSESSRSVSPVPVPAPAFQIQPTYQQ
ncbi:hypothetical protein DFH05DRAFT_1520634 [Lentinula detonsa]|uniref:Uncharacterized protein n=1 Tax=Lentinula detonsa TaxID=2804962 RepID=A0A9W8U1K0_9AGAR|nr:hypothetical protein DFH05DRAFT_1520634 [Lentinula detonsa]